MKFLIAARIYNAQRRDCVSIEADAREQMDRRKTIQGAERLECNAHLAFKYLLPYSEQSGSISIACNLINSDFHDSSLVQRKPAIFKVIWLAGWKSHPAHPEHSGGR